MNKDTRFSRHTDMRHIIDNMRKEDIDELIASGTTPQDAIYDGYYKSHPCLTVIDPKSGEPGVMMGVVRRGFGLDLIWLLGTDSIEHNAVGFAKQSRPILKYLYYTTGSLGFYNYTHHANTLHHKWLKWLGFKFIRKVQLGPNGEDFYEFVRLRDTAEKSVTQG